MSEPQDKLIGVQISDGTTTRTYSAYRIDYDDSRHLREIIGLSDGDILVDNYTGAIKYVGQTAVDRGVHTVKDGYQRKVLVEDTTTRDEVQADLDEAGVSYTTEEIVTSDSERILFDREDVTSDQEVLQVLASQDGVVDRNRVSQVSKDTTATAIQNVSDADSQEALEHLYEIVTGETTGETLQ